MVSFPRIDLAKGFSVDRDEARETARRQFWISAVVVFAGLLVALLDHGSDASRQTAYAGKANANASERAAPINAGVRYVDRTTPRSRVAVASTAN